ncbi:unnamed protein product, partial [Rotaria sp. Silwood2]
AFVDQFRSILSENQYKLLCQGETLVKEDLQKVLTADSHIYICESAVKTFCKSSLTNVSP